MIKKLFFLFIIGITIQSCNYDFIKEAEPVDPGSNVSFSQQILPIFNSNNNCTACHKPGSTSPDLTAANAYSSVGSLINTSTPASSRLYTFPEPSTGTHNWKKYTASQAQLILLWITQGALNN